MQLYHAVALAMVAVQASAAPNATSESDLNGWYSCSEYTFSDEGSSDGGVAECAVYSAPLCYPGICEAPANADSKVDVFVKRMVATAGNAETASNVWLLAGGPGLSSTSSKYIVAAQFDNIYLTIFFVIVESLMTDLHAELEGTVNVYTMDHRGTGRSTRLDCVAAQDTTTNSPVGTDNDPSEIPACAQDLQEKYGDLAAFSVTTAATDVATFIEKYTNRANTLVYGGSYGTMFAVRLMQLAPPTVTGYVLEGISYTPGAPADKFYYTSNWDVHFGKVADAFMGLCKSDRVCNARFKSKSLSDTLQGLIKQLDNKPNSTCAELVYRTANPSQSPPSFALRSALGDALMDPDLRTLIPPVVYRLNRCSAEDVDVLTHFFTSVYSDSQTQTQDNALESTLLNLLIVYSEMMEKPWPSMAKMEARFTNAKMSSQGGVFLTAPQYCAFSKEKSAICDPLNLGAYDANPIGYKRDQYWNKTATIPSNGSVLILSGKLDPQTPDKYAKVLLDALDGKEKELVSFKYASHNGDAWSNECGQKLLLSYVRTGGDLKAMDRSCLDESPAFNMTTPEYFTKTYLGTDDVYDGVYNSSLASSS
ncbi:hypothetical protein P3T76_005793 [Phytophthora citrophthora]|uniref:Peptidase S33 tripeptidyl aminopeptidase-like C-terminal domain-containing protein n=1 Tax=Phytophthora citrophthora TaxID=4793 RepID=A0AAD9GR30_9STRA|nr:hypothetical protein P3T76_005787 [Phytophthora citrophthora]KAK1943156.1 hypothetical protein P3T76_005793 [Phytophthora citrophthora]